MALKSNGMADNDVKMAEADQPHITQVNQTNFLVGRGTMKFISSAVLRPPRVVKGRWFPMQSHSASIYSHQTSNVNRQSVYAYPLLDMNILNKLYSPRYLQEMQATYNGTTWEVGPTYHWLLRQNNLAGSGATGFGLFNPGTTSGALSNANSSVNTSKVLGADQPFGATLNNANKLLYNRGVYLAGKVDVIVTIRNNGIRPTYVDMYEIKGKMMTNLKSDTPYSDPFPWWYNMLKGYLNDSINRTYSENDWTPYTPTNPALANVALPQDSTPNADPSNNLEFNPKDLSTDSDFAQRFYIFNHRHAALGAGQQVTVKLAPIRWYIDLKKLHSQLLTVPGIIPTGFTSANLANFWINVLLPKLCHGIMFRQKGGIAHDSTTPVNVGVDDSEIDIKIDSKYNWTLKADDAIVMPTKGVFPSGTITDPFIVTSNSVQQG